MRALYEVPIEEVAKTHLKKTAPQQNLDARQMYKADVILQTTLVAHHQAAIAKQPTVQLLNLPSPLVAAQPSSILRLGLPTITPMGCKHLNPTRRQCCI